MTAFLTTARRQTVPLALALFAALAPHRTPACACGCNVFDVGTASMFPSGAGATAFVEYDTMDQNENWSGRSRAPASANPDQRIRTDFVTAGLQYEFNRSWGVEVEAPYWRREFRTTDEAGSIVDATHGALGDIRLKGIYTGFSDDMSTGLTFGVKLPSGDSTYRNFDPDTQIGSGSTDLLLGVYHLGNLSASGEWRYFAQTQWDRPVAHTVTYAPGSEWDAAVGAYYEGWNVTSDLKIAPVAAVSAAIRGHDGGPLGDPGNTGYARLLVDPGLEADFRRLSVYVDVAVPVYVDVSGNQLVASKFVRMNLSYRF